jgi:hypothetical protein
MRKVLKKLFITPMESGELSLALNLNDLTTSKTLRSLWESSYVHRDPAGIYSVAKGKKEMVLEILKNKKRNKYEIHKILSDCIDLSSDSNSPDVLAFFELKLTTLNARILESKLKELKEFISKIQNLPEDKIYEAKTYYAFQGIVEDKILRQQVDEMYVRI